MSAEHLAIGLTILSGGVITWLLMHLHRPPPARPDHASPQQRLGAPVRSPDGCEASAIEYQTDGRPRERVVAQAPGGGPGPIDFTLAVPERGFLAKAPRGLLRLGEPAFDAAIALTGPDAWRAVALSGDERAVVLAAVRVGWRYSRHAWQLHDATSLGHPMRVHFEAGLQLAGLTHALAGDIVPRLVARVGDEPVAAVAEHAYGTLLARFPTDPRTLACGQRLIADPATGEGLRLMAAHALRERPIVIAVALGDDPVLATRALELLANGAKLPIVKAAFAELTERVLRGQLVDDRVPILARTVARGEPRAWLDDAAAEALLLHLAQSSPSVELVDGLGRLGGLGAVPALARWRDQLFGGDVSTAARQAIAAIHARAGDPERGRLELAQGGGELSLADAAAAEPPSAEAADVNRGS